MFKTCKKKKKKKKKNCVYKLQNIFFEKTQSSLKSMIWFIIIKKKLN